MSRSELPRPIDVLLRAALAAMRQPARASVPAVFEGDLEQAEQWIQEAIDALSFSIIPAGYLKALAEAKVRASYTPPRVAPKGGRS